MRRHLPRCAPRVAILAIVAATLLAQANPASAGHLIDHAHRFVITEALDLSPLPDLLQVVVRDRELLAIDGDGGNIVRAALGIGEEVNWTGSRGRVAVVITDRRILAVTPRSGNWVETRIRLAEKAPSRALLGQRVALLVTDQRVIGFEGMSGTLVESELAPREEVEDLAVDLNVAVVVTHRRALGIAAFGGGFFETEVGVRQTIDGLSSRADFVTIATPHELLIFRAPSATWQRRELSLR